MLLFGFWQTIYGIYIYMYDEEDLSVGLAELVGKVSEGEKVAEKWKRCKEMVAFLCIYEEAL